MYVRSSNILESFEMPIYAYMYTNVAQFICEKNADGISVSVHADEKKA